MSDSIKYILEENKLPKTWYNINADLPSPPPPPLHCPPPPPPQADKVSAASAGQVMLFASRLERRFLVERILFSSPFILDSLRLCRLCFLGIGNRTYLDCWIYNISIVPITQNYMYPD